MSMEVALSVDNMNLADAMGFGSTAEGSGGSSNLYRITSTVIQEAVDGKVANSPVNKDEPSYAIVGGRLIKIIRYSFPIKPLKNYKKAEIVGFSC